LFPPPRLKRFLRIDIGGSGVPWHRNLDDLNAGLLQQPAGAFVAAEARHSGKQRAGDEDRIAAPVLREGRDCIGAFRIFERLDQAVDQFCGDKGHVAKKHDGG
jgi:hypothetical protein